MLDFEIQSIFNTCEKLVKYKIIIIGPFYLKNDWINLFNLQLDYLCFENKYFKSVFTYNNLLCDLGFYKKFTGYERLLIIHSDAWIFKDSLNEFLSFDYVGAPWSHPPIYLEKYGVEDKGLVGNGGFSLRNVKYVTTLLKSDKQMFTLKEMLYNVVLLMTHFEARKFVKKGFKLLFNFIFFNKVKYISKYAEIINEDVFYGVVGPTKINASMPSPQIASEFAIETTVEFLKNGDLTIPMGCHSFAKRARTIWEYRLSEKNE